MRPDEHFLAETARGRGQHLEGTASFATETTHPRIRNASWAGYGPFNVFPALKDGDFHRWRATVPPRQITGSELHSRRDHAKRHSQNKSSASFQGLRYL